MREVKYIGCLCHHRSSEVEDKESWLPGDQRRRVTASADGHRVLNAATSN